MAFAAYATLSVVVVLPAPSIAAGYECGTLRISSTYSTGVGWDPAPSGHIARGAAGTLTVRPSDLCAEDERGSNFSDSWVMISAEDGNGYAQSGFEKAGINGTVDFAAWWGGTNSPYSAQIQYGTVHRFGGDQIRYKEAWTKESANCQFNDCITMYGAGRVLAATVWNPLSYWKGPFQPQYVAEARYIANDIPGSIAAPTDYSTLAYQYSPEFLDWNTQPCGRTPYYPPTARWHLDTSGPCNTLQTYTG